MVSAMATTIAILSQKGGTGKTTTTRSLADVFERVGLSTLAVDADPQGNLSDYFDTDPAAQPTLGEVLAGQAKAVDAIHGDVIPANLGLAEAELILSGKMGRELTLRNALREAKRRYDAILIDCPPTLGLLTVNALCAADQALLSTEAEYFSLQGVEQALEVIALARDNLNPELDVLGIVLNIANMRTNHARQTLETLTRALRREGLRHRDPPLDRLRRIGRARDPDPRLPPRPRDRLPACSPRRSSTASRCPSSARRSSGWSSSWCPSGRGAELHAESHDRQLSLGRRGAILRIRISTAMCVVKCVLGRLDGGLTAAMVPKGGSAPVPVRAQGREARRSPRKSARAAPAAANGDSSGVLAASCAEGSGAPPVPAA